MRYGLLDQIGSFKDIAGDWDEALLRSASDNPFLLSDFIVTWWKYYGDRRKLLIFVMYDNASIAGGIPLCLEKALLRKNIVHVGGQAANLTHFFSVDKSVNPLGPLMDLLKGRTGWDNIVLSRVLAGDPIGNYIKSIDWGRYNGIRCRLSDSDSNGTIDLSVGYEGIIGRLNNRLRKYLANGRDEARKMGKLELIRMRGANDVRRLFEEYKRLSISSFRARKAASAFEETAYGNFFGELLEAFDAKGRLDAHRLAAGPNTLAVSFGYRTGKDFKWILTAYNPEFQRMRPGHMMLDFLIQEAIKNGDTNFDMYYGGELFYKQQWCNRVVPLMRLEISRDSILNTSAMYAEKAVRSNRALLNALKKARNMTQRLKQRGV